MKDHAILYLGIDPQHYQVQGTLTHCSIIKTIPRSFDDPAVQNALKMFSSYTHVIMTSKTTVDILETFLRLEGIPLAEWQNKQTIVVGQITGSYLKNKGIYPQLIAKNETAEGIIEELEKIDINNAHFFWPHSLQARPVIQSFFEQHLLRHTCCVFYHTEKNVPDPLPNLEDFDEIIFTSPSTVDAFISIFGAFPSHKVLKPLGPITANYLKNKFQK